MGMLFGTLSCSYSYDSWAAATVVSGSEVKNGTYIVHQMPIRGSRTNADLRLLEVSLFVPFRFLTEFRSISTRPFYIRVLFFARWLVLMTSNLYSSASNGSIDMDIAIPPPVSSLCVELRSYLPRQAVKRNYTAAEGHRDCGPKLL